MACLHGASPKTREDHSAEGKDPRQLNRPQVYHAELSSSGEALRYVGRREK
jgi:hypothetical protein